jgi:predicted phosphodiesterase
VECQERVVRCDGRATEIELVPLGDIHLGTCNCDLDELRATVRYIAANPNCLWLGMGDYLECIRHQDKRFDPRNIPPRHLTRLGDIVASQTEELEEILAPILTPEKCVGLHTGNHEETAYLVYGADVVMNLCRKYGLKWLGYSALSRLLFKRGKTDTVSYKIHSQHGHGGGRKVGGKVNLLHDLPSNVTADIHIMGHVHDRIYDDGVQLDMVHKGAKLVAREKLYGITGTYYRTYQEGSISYGEKKNYKPTAIGSLLITFAPFSPDTKLHIEKLRTSR